MWVNGTGKMNAEGQEGKRKWARKGGKGREEVRNVKKGKGRGLEGG